MSLSNGNTWRAVFALHAAAGALAWWVLPQGFPCEHLRFWSNTVIPLGVVVAMVVALLAPVMGWSRFERTAVAGLPALWLGFAITFAIVFPRSGWKLAGIAFLIGVWLATRARRTLLSQNGHDWPVVACSVVMLSVGAVWAIAQRAPQAATRPLGVAAPVPPDDLQRKPAVFHPNPSLRAWPNQGHVQVTYDDVQIDVDPLLTFISRSSDRGWTLLASRADREGSGRRLLGAHTEGNAVTFFYQDDGATSLRIDPSGNGRGVRLDAITRLERPIYSHLNSFAYLRVAAQRQLALEFSPCPGTRITAEPFDYPVGRPARCAYWDDHGTFRVVEASSGEKGPFREVASGPLSRGDQLVITLWDGDAPVARIEFKDWAQQASTQLSPTAGWGLPANAIEFSRDGESSASEISIFVSLAATSVGRGFDTVGHAAGTYLNRMRIEPARGR